MSDYEVFTEWEVELTNGAGVSWCHDVSVIAQSAQEAISKATQDPDFIRAPKEFMYATPRAIRLLYKLHA